MVGEKAIGPTFQGDSLSGDRERRGELEFLRISADLGLCSGTLRSQFGSYYLDKRSRVLRRRVTPIF